MKNIDSTYTNNSYCNLCQGKCCKSCGCFYYPEDVNLTFDNLISLLKEGRVSISTMISFKYKSLKEQEIAFMLLLRERNIKRDVIDLFSLPTTCASLTKKGCMYSEAKRPSGGLHLIPAFKPVLCHYDEEHFSKLSEWQQYQELLSSVIFQMTGLSFEEKLEEDIENYFYGFLKENFEEVDSSSLTEHKVMILPIIERMYPHLKEKAQERIKNENTLSLKRIPK